ncbi:MAG: DUF2304 domain-containing protein [Ruthenibacterium sp.]
MIAIGIRVLRVVGSVLTFWFILRYIRKSKVRIEDTFFWIFFSVVLVLLSFFPNLAVWASETLKIMSPINFVFILIIFILIVKQFFLSMKLSQLEIRTAALAQQLAIDRKQTQEKGAQKGDDAP